MSGASPDDPPGAPSTPGDPIANLAGITFDPAKRDRTLRERGLDFHDAEAVFAGRFARRQDTREDYGEPRYISAGPLNDRFVVVTWTRATAPVASFP